MTLLVTIHTELSRLCSLLVGLLHSSARFTPSLRPSSSRRRGALSTFTGLARPPTTATGSNPNGAGHPIQFDVCPMLPRSTFPCFIYSLLRITPDSNTVLCHSDSDHMPYYKVVCSASYGVLFPHTHTFGWCCYTEPIFCLMCHIAMKWHFIRSRMSDHGPNMLLLPLMLQQFCHLFFGSCACAREWDV